MQCLFEKVMRLAAPAVLRLLSITHYACCVPNASIRDINFLPTYLVFDLILTCLLNSLLAPVGLHRKSFITPSKGKRKRQQERQKEDLKMSNDEVSSVPPAPEISVHIDIGLANISRNLQEMAASREIKPDSFATDAAPQSAKAGTKPPYSVVFVARAGQSSAFHYHFPQMVALASKAQPAGKEVRLVGLSRPCEERFSAALGIPRVSSIALRGDAPAQAKGLVDFVMGHVAPVDVAWLEEAVSGKFLETNIEGVPTKVGAKKGKS